jgi:hypothetical protein
MKPHARQAGAARRPEQTRPRGPVSVVVVGPFACGNGSYDFLANGTQASSGELRSSWPNDAAVGVGRVRLFGAALLSPSPLSRLYSYGHFFENGRHLIVSGGLGCSWWPVRFGVPPEIVLVDIAAQATATTRRLID